MNPQVVAAFFTYFAVLLSIGLAAHKSKQSDTDFIMGNRSLNYWLTALSAHASDMSAWLFMGLPGIVYAGGIGNAWVAVSLTVFMYLNWQFVAKKLRVETENTDSYTLSSYFEKRFNDRSGMLRLITAIMTVGFMMHYLAAGLIAMGFLFESLFGINYYLGLSVAMLVAVSYTFSGGYVTIAWTDTFQAIFLVLVIILVPTLAYFQLPSSTLTISYEGLGFSNMLLALSWGLGYFGLPHVLTKFMGIRDAEEIKKSKWVGITWQIIALTASVSVGVIAVQFFAGSSVSPEMVFVEMVKVLFHPYIGGIILCAILAANMSTMDSQILVSATVISEDLYKHFINKSASSATLLKISRMGVLAVSFLALAIAFSKDSSVYQAVKFAWTGLGCSFGPLVLMSLYSKTANRWGAIAGILVGGLTAAVWPSLMGEAIPAMIPGFILSLLAIWSVSLLFDKK